MISDFKHGRLAPPDDPEALARVILDQWYEFRPRLPHEPRRSGVEDEFSAGGRERHWSYFKV